MIIAQTEKIQDYSDFLNSGRAIGFDSTSSSLPQKLKKVAIRSPLFHQSQITTQYTTHMDWLQLVITPEKGKYFQNAIDKNKSDEVLDDLFELINELIPNQDWDDKPGKFNYGKIFYNRAVSSDKILIMYSLPEDIPEHSKDKPSILISLPGSICQKLELHQILGLIAYFQSIGKAKFTRTDIALDDYSRSISYDEIAGAIAGGGVRGYKSMCKIVASLLTTINNMRHGWSFTFGEKSDKELQIYDKQAESGGTIPSVRFEARLRDDRAENFVNLLMKNFDYNNSFLYLYSTTQQLQESGENLPQYYIDECVQTMAGAVNGCISFVQSGQEKIRKSRCKLLGWWQNHLNNTANSIKIKSVSRALTSLPDKLFNMIRCAKSVTKIKRFFDTVTAKNKDIEFTFESFINLLSCIGSGRLNQSDNLDLINWVSRWGDSSESFDNLLEYAGVFDV